MIKVSDYIVSFLVSRGVRHVFTLVGGQAMHLADSLGRNPGLKPVSCLHEQAAAMMAEAYSRATDNFGAAVVTTGPGGTNAMTGVAGAWLDSTPCLFLSGQFKVQDLIADQKIRQTCLQGSDPVSFVAPITKYVFLVTDPGSIRYHLEKAYYLATHDRPGPSWLDLPLDVQAALVDETRMQGFDPAELAESGVPAPEPSVLDEALRLLAAARRPVILAGHGIRLSRAIPEFLGLVDQLGIPVLTSINGIDLVWEDHPLFFGRPNYWGQRAANFIVQNADVLLSLGAGLHIETTGFNHEAFCREAKKIVVDIDGNELRKKTVRPDLAVRADAGAFIRALGARARGFANPSLPGWVDTCRLWKFEYPPVLPEYARSGNRIHPFHFVDQLSEAASPGDVIIPGNAGTHFTTCVQALRVRKGQRVFSEIGIGAMGYSLPAAIAACIATGRRTVCLTGDGGIQLNIQELQTALTHRLDLKIFVMNNHGYMSIRNTQKNFCDGLLIGCDAEHGLVLPDIIKVARAYGYRTFRLTRPSGLKERIARILATPGPVLCEVMLMTDVRLQPKVAARKLPDGRMVSNPLEDLSPPLDREEFRRHMFIREWDR